MCTSIVAQRANGTMYLGHNFDYPTSFAPGLFNARFIRGGREIFLGTMLAGTTIIVTGVAKGHFAVSIDARSSFRPSLIAATQAASSGGYIFGELVRRSLEMDVSYERAVSFYQQTPMIAGGYLILAGAKAGEGAVVTTNTSAMLNDVWRLGDDRGWYLVETNYDHWENPPASDDRRTPAMMHLDAIGTNHISVLGLWNVLSTAPNFRAGPTPSYAYGATLTTHLVEPSTGGYHTYLRWHNATAELVYV